MRRIPAGYLRSGNLGGSSHLVRHLSTILPQTHVRRRPACQLYPDRQLQASVEAPDQSDRAVANASNWHRVRLPGQIMTNGCGAGNAADTANLARPPRLWVRRLVDPEAAADGLPDWRVRYRRSKLFTAAAPGSLILGRDLTFPGRLVGRTGSFGVPNRGSNPRPGAVQGVQSGRHHRGGPPVYPAVQAAATANDDHQ